MLDNIIYKKNSYVSIKVNLVDKKNLYYKIT